MITSRRVPNGTVFGVSDGRRHAGVWYGAANLVVGGCFPKTIFMTALASTPLHPPDFFHGSWTGRGEMRPVRAFALIIPTAAIQYSSHVTRLSETVWRTREVLAFSSGFRTERTMFGEVLAPGRAHVTGDDMPGGAALSLTGDRFDSEPYYMWVPYAGRRWWMGCTDQNHVDPSGTIHNTISLRYARIPVAAISLTIRRVP